MKRDLYADVTARILAELETGAAPWIKPWSVTAGRNTPQNAVTGRPYSGCNVVLLWMGAQANNWALPRFLTYKQATEAGGQVRKGEHGTKVIFVKQLRIKDKETDKERSVPMLREYTVFNVAQCDDLPAHVVNGRDIPKVRNHDARDQDADSFMVATGAAIVEGHGEACYRPGVDNISLPAFEAFKSADTFYGTAFHELGHWTGHKTRLDRLDWKAKFGNGSYAAEELVAELCAAFLCAEFSFDGELRHAGYIGHWIQLLKDDPRAFVSAASKASAAANFLRDKALAETIEEEPTALAA